MKFNREIVVKNFGYQSKESYYNDSSCHQFIPLIKTPTMFMHSENDPLVPASGIDLEAISANPNTIAAVTALGAHTAYHENLFNTQKQWFIPICLDFFDAVK